MNPDTGIPEIHTEAALRAVDVVMCKSRLCVELMAAFRKDKSMRFGIMYTNHTTPDPLRLGARHPRACSRLRTATVVYICGIVSASRLDLPR